MPMRSQQQRKYLWATDPELARKYEDETPKGAKLPKKVPQSKKQAAYEEGFRELLLEKMAAEWFDPLDPGGPIKRFFARMQNEALPSDSNVTLGKIPQLVPTDSGKPATRAMLEILRDPSLSKEERNILMMRMQQRLPIGRAGRKSEDLIGVGLPGAATDSLNLYLAANRNPHMSSYLQKLLQIGMLAANRVAGPYRVIDHRRKPEEERHSPWKISLL